MGRPQGVERATGRAREDWFAVLDEWGAAGRPYREIAAWMTGEHGLSRWWAQKLIVEYEQARGIRPPGVRRDGTFEVGAGRTIAAPVERVFEAFVDGRRRRGWLPGGSLTLRTSEPGRSARFDSGSGTRVNVTFERKTPAKTTVTVVHARIGSAEEAQAAKEQWRERLGELKSLLER